jgi:hypothetical protein
MPRMSRIVAPGAPETGTPRNGDTVDLTGQRNRMDVVVIREEFRWRQESGSN